MLKKIAKFVGIPLALFIVAALGFYFWAAHRSEEILSQHFETHRIEFPIPFPLSDDEVAALRAELLAREHPVSTASAPLGATPVKTAAVPGTPATNGAGASPDAAAAPPPPDPLAGVDLKAIALERAVARGKHLVESRFVCIECHAKDFGGGTMIDAPPVGRMFGVNITSGRGGQVAGFKASDWDRIVRHGVLHDGRPAMMPSGDFEGMSDHELSDVVAYIQSVPPVDREMPRPVLGPVLNVMMAVGKVKTAAAQKKDHQAAHPVEPPAPAATVAFGQHMAQICTTCHTQSFVGGPITGGDPSWPPAANLTPHAEGLAGWTYDDFAHTMKSGKNRTGEELRVPMKSMAQYASNMTDTELKALWAYLQSLPPLPTRRD